MNKEVYVIGGRYGANDFFEHCEKFSTLTGEWSVIAPMNKKKMNASACIFKNQSIFAIGGFNRNVCSNDIEKYSVKSNSWESIRIEGEL